MKFQGVRGIYFEMLLIIKHATVMVENIADCN